MFSLKDKKALVTGGSRGIGRGIALALAKQGADVAINYRSNTQEAEAAAAEITKMGREAFSVQADVSNKASVGKMFEEIKTKWGKLDILVNNAGILHFAPFEQLTEEQWDQVMAVNLKGQFLCSQEAVKLMGQGAKIINIASIASGGVGIGFSQIAHYTASKGGVVALTENMALELGSKGINVNAVAPGVIETDMTKAMLADEKQKAGIMTRIPKGRVGKPEDIGAAVAFLASDEADYITGAVLYVDGGWLAS
ncbi:beta-ketoacyl-ACP reductase [Candidatus Shapirobacteria bacterium CG10_big_fil_rev_8_21_14_0_10_38_14]|uniref:Beta-ketoacyl-ACP reductase n=1 Tax=Candidatus Shapirobacteria bacterium CG10_big_fil_rev_8_21_14_0_10_38_14 TaxID=1974483 RepID=A0A2M8L5S7_9BACT|nr:MAG: beta-ketoacyl-ACP reductase [Candidatus Shapirobacteria bacterium CG10_big_fil_rev_8_21_14_0_10_38_14]